MTESTQPDTNYPPLSGVEARNKDHDWLISPAMKPQSGDEYILCNDEDLADIER